MACQSFMRINNTFKLKKKEVRRIYRDRLSHGASHHTKYTHRRDFQRKIKHVKLNRCQINNLSIPLQRRQHCMTVHL